MSTIKTILVTGSSGFIGSDFVKQYGSKYQIIGLDVVEPQDKTQCYAQYIGDIRNQELLNMIFKTHKIDAVIHTAAEKSLINCETDQSRAYEINYESTLYLAALAEAHNAHFIFISSDQVFHGDSANSTEDSNVDPINYYGRLKTMVEAKLIGKTNVSICRTALVFGDIPKEQMAYFDSIKSSETLAVQGFIVQQTKYCLENGHKIILPSDEFVSPTHVRLLSEQLDSVLCNQVFGILHCCGGDRISRYEMGLAIAEHYGLSSDTICAKGVENPLRPKDVSLSYEKTERLLKMKFPDFRSMLNKYM